MTHFFLKDHFRDFREQVSPNQNDRPENTTISLLVIHNISLPPGEFGGNDIDDLFLNRLDPQKHPYFRQIADLRVSAHVFIDRLGRLTQYVPFERRAWHAGESSFEGCSNCNHYSIGIELEGIDEVPYEEAQYECLTKLTNLLIRQYPAITRDRIVGHSDIAPGRKTDPGPAFDWVRFRSLLDSPSL